MTRERQLRFWLIGMLLFLIALYLLRGVLLPFVAGIAIAYLLDPLCDRLERAGCSRTLATIIVTICFVIVAATALVLIVPLIQGQIIDLIVQMPRLISAVQRWATPLLAGLEERFGAGQVQEIRQALGGQLGGILKWIAGAFQQLLTSGLALVNILSLLFITPTVSFYLLRDWDHLVAKIDGWLPRRHAPAIRQQARLIDETLAGFARGQATVCLILGTFYAVALSVAGLDFGLAVGLMTGALSFIPFVGTITGFVTSMGLAIAQFTGGPDGTDWLSIGLVAGIFVIGQVVEGNFLTPKLVGDRIGLHPVWVIFALLAGGALFGFVGVLLGLPAAAVVGVLTRFGLTRYLGSHLYHGGLPVVANPPVAPPPSRVDEPPGP
jgi:predicted PurR-regulated permease PerM